jgi:hypothetical protein
MWAEQRAPLSLSSALRTTAALAPSGSSAEVYASSEGLWVRSDQFMMLQANEVSPTTGKREQR